MRLLRHGRFGNSLLLCGLQLSLLPSLISSYRNAEKLERFWNHISEAQSGLYDSAWHPEKKDYFQFIRTCLDEGMKDSFDGEARTNGNPEVYNTIAASNQDTTLLVQVRNALTARQAQSIEILANCTARALPGQFHEQRAFDSKGGNEVTFMNTLLQVFLPDVTKAVYDTSQLAYEHAGWGQKNVAGREDGDANKGRTGSRTNIPNYFPPVQECGLRTTEYLNYKGYENLGEHGDAGSMYTVLFALSAPTDYEGGDYFIRDGASMEVQTVRPEQYSAIVFLSEQWHGVTSLKGDRRMFTNELWKYDDPPWLHLRPIQESMQHFTEVYEKQRATEEVSPAGAEQISDVGTKIEALWPSYEATVQWFVENDKPWTVDGHLNPDYYKGYVGVPIAQEEHEAVSSGTSSQGHYFQTVSRWISDFVMGKEIPEPEEL